MALEHALLHAGTHAGSISSVRTRVPLITRSSQKRTRAAGVEVEAKEPVVAPASATAALVGPPRAKVPPSPGTRNFCCDAAMTSTHASAVKPFCRPTICLPVASITSMMYFLYTVPKTLKGSTGSFSSGVSNRKFACEGPAKLRLRKTAAAETARARRRLAGNPATSTSTPDESNAPLLSFLPTLPLPPRRTPIPPLQAASKWAQPPPTPRLLTRCFDQPHVRAVDLPRCCHLWGERAGAPALGEGGEGATQHCAANPISPFCTSPLQTHRIEQRELGPR
mmetsp:Transcript_6192/g.15363  ORF Transcript_6192/g.15363 Transcript_6192/m.15363 type:complete len:280 (+) Transcript_6192:2313-3152(+)